MSQHQTTVEVKNPSASHALTVSLQGRVTPRAKLFYEYRDDPGHTRVRANALGAIGGGQFESNNEGEGKSGLRRFVFVAEQPTVIEVVAYDGDLIVEELELTPTDSDVGFTWDATKDLGSVRRAKYEIGPSKRISIRAKRETDGMYVNFRNGEADLQVIQQTEHEYWHTARAGVWTTPLKAADVAPGLTQSFVVNDASRLVLSTDSKEELGLIFSNKNMLHVLRLITVDSDGKEADAVNISTSQGAGVGYASARVVIKKGRSAIVQQSPQ